MGGYFLMRTNFFVVLLCVVLAFSCAFAFSSCALSFTDNSAGNVETPIDPDEPTTDPDEPTTDPDEPEQPAAPTEGLEFMLLDNEMIAGLHEILGANLPDGYLLVGMENVTETDIVVPSTYNGLPVVGLFFWQTKISPAYIFRTVSYSFRHQMPAAEDFQEDVSKTVPL